MRCHKRDRNEGKQHKEGKNHLLLPHHERRNILLGPTSCCVIRQREKVGLSSCHDAMAHRLQTQERVTRGSQRGWGLLHSMVSSLLAGRH